MQQDLDSSLNFVLEKILLEDEMNEGCNSSGICRLHLRGHCIRGANCPYRHWRPPEKSTVCKHWLRGLCKKGDECEYLHQQDIDKMPECQFYGKYGECHNLECEFRHVNPEDKMTDCPHYARGFCKNGPKCRHKHVRTQPCELFLAGFCPKGSACPNGHPKFELPLETHDHPPADPYGAAPHRGRISCHICQGPHKANNCPNRSQMPKTIVCFRCGDPSHKANACPGRNRNWHQYS
ncbi:hypothetical protein RCL1_001130 [Eukaryota sp. TZLM3-RCL]